VPRFHLILFLALLPLASPPTAAGLWNDLRQGANQAIDKGREMAGEAAEVTKDVTGKVFEGGKTLATDTREHFQREGTPAELRAECDATAYSAMDRLFVDDPEAHGFFDRSFGYAVFEMRQVSFGVTAGYGYGVARELDTDVATYMKMATGGVGYSLGVGGFAFQLVILFEDEATYRRFLVEGVEGRAEAATMVGEDTNYLATEFREGLIIYKLTKQGFKVSAGLTGMRFWADEALNQGQPMPPKALPPVQAPAEAPAQAESMPHIQPQPQLQPAPPAPGL
jgi:hypothetical protein